MSNRKSMTREQMITEIINNLIKLGVCPPSNDYEEQLAQKEREKVAPEIYEMRKEAILDELNRLEQKHAESSQKH